MVFAHDAVNLAPSTLENDRPILGLTDRLVPRFDEAIERERDKDASDGIPAATGYTGQNFVADVNRVYEVDE